MKLIELPRSPYWGANLHIGYYPDGKKRYSLRSSKVVRDPSRVDSSGRRLDKEEARQILMGLQVIANQAMASDSEVVERRELEEMVASLLRACGKRVFGGAPSWDAFASDYLERHCRDLSASTACAYRSKKNGFDRWLDSHGRLSRDSSIAEFRLADIQAFYDWWIAEGGQTTTSNTALKIVSMVFEQAVIADYIAKNPCVGVKKRDNVMIPRQPFTLADISAISRALVERAEDIDFCGEWQLAIRFAIFTGAREGDCVSLRWSDFSEDCSRVSFVPAKKARLHSLGKVDASVTLILPEFVAAEFRAARSVSDSECVTPNLRLIKPGKNGLGARFRKILKLAGVEVKVREANGAKGVAQCSHSFHSFRHFLKTELRAGGVSAATSNYVTGHEDDKVAARYVHERAETILRECQPVFEEFAKAIAG